MKLVAVSDVFMHPEYYTEAVKNFPEFELTKVIHFGADDRSIMREISYKIERGGSEAVEPPAELWDAVEDADVLMVHICPVPAKLIERAKNLKMILLNRGGSENVDLEAASCRGIAVLGNPAHNANAVAEFAVGMMLSETRNIARAHAALKQGTWREKYPRSERIYELRGRTLGIVGFGTIGRLVAERLSGFHMNIIASDPNVAADDPDLARLGVTLCDTETVMKAADIITLHARSTEIVLSERELSLMRPDAFFINSARPHLIDNEYLAKMLAEGRLAGAATDVFMNEPVEPEHPFLALDNITLSNHRAGDTVNSYADSPAMLFTESRKLLAGGEPRFWRNRKDTVKYYR